MHKTLAVMLTSTLAALSPGPAIADPLLDPGVYVEPQGPENPLLACYRAQLRSERLGRRRPASPIPGLHKILDCGLKWVALEPKTRQTARLADDRIGELLNQMWRDGRFHGARPADAYFVHCGQSEDKWEDHDSGPLECLIGVAVLRPGEFEFLRTAQRTAGSP